LVMEDLAMDTQALETLTELLDLDGFEVVDVASDAGKKHRLLTVVPTALVALCPCGCLADQRHVCFDRKVVDLPVVGWRTELLVRLFQFKCGKCGRFFTPKHAFLAEGAHATERFLERLAELATHGDVSTAARFLGVAEKTAEDWYYKYVERRKRREAVKPIESLGIDELSLKKDTASSSAC
jgi:transposase